VQASLLHFGKPELSSSRKNYILAEGTQLVLPQRKPARETLCVSLKNVIVKNLKTMLKLYKLTANQLHYWETWDKDGKTGIVHWGVVGQRGQDKEVKSGLFSNFRKAVQKEINDKLKDGYAEFDEDKVSFLEIEYTIDSFGTEQDLEKRHRLETKLDGILGWTGLGHTDGGSIGSGTMEVGCIVVDFEIAKKVIETNLKDTEFADYSRIYKMDNE
jgi:predicted DNA-binding WGR domain protein